MSEQLKPYKQASNHPIFNENGYPALNFHLSQNKILHHFYYSRY
jgi:hypothetical protein